MDSNLRFICTNIEKTIPERDFDRETGWIDDTGKWEPEGVELYIIGKRRTSNE